VVALGPPFFATGVLWRLAECGRLKDVEYISGVSGGTYVATAFASHVVAAERPQGTNIDRWYRELLAAMMLRMQYNTPYLNRDMGQEVADIAPESQEGSGALPRICDLFLLLAVGAGTVLRAPVSISCLFLLPAVQVIEMLYGAEMRAEFCKDVLEPDTEVLSILGKSSAQKQALVLLALLCAAFIVHVCQMFLTRHVRTKMAPSDEESPKDGRASLGIARCYTGLRSSLAVLVRLLAAGLLLDALVVGPVAWRLHRYATVEGGTELRYCQCAAFFEHKSCDHCGEVALTSHNTTRWRERWVSLNCSALTAARLTGPTPQVSREAVAADWLIHRPLSQTFLPVLLMVFAFALLASLLLLPIFPDLFVSTFNVMVPFLLFGSTFFLVQFRVLGDITHERYAGSVLDEMTWKRIMASSLVFSLIGICFSRFLRTFMHRYYSRSLHLAFYAGGKNCNWSAVRKNPYCPLLLLNAAVNDYLRLVDTEPISDITFSQLHTGGQRVGYFWAFGARPLARTAALSGGAIDGFIMSKYDSVSLRFWLEFLGVYMGDFVHIARTAGPGLRFRAWLQRLPTLLWWQLIYGLLLAATILSMHPSLDRCSIAFRLCQWSALLAAGLAGLSFFSFLPFLGFLQHSPLLRTLQQATRFYYQSPQPPGTVYISDGGVVDNTGVLSLLRRRCRRILAVYAGEEAQGKELKCIKKLLMHMHEERIGYLYDLENPQQGPLETIRKCVESHGHFLKFGIHYADDTSGERSVLMVVRNQVPAKHRDDGSVELADASGSEMSADGSSGPLPVFEHLTEEELLGYRDPELDEILEGMQQTDLGGCCCDCCHKTCFNAFCGKFPKPPTSNQFLTPQMFSSLCRLGRAALTTDALASLGSLP